MFRFKKLRCSFCGKNDSQVEKLVAGPRGYTGGRVYICDACVAITVDIMNNPPRDNQPQSHATSIWHKLSHRIRTLFSGGQRRVSSSPARSVVIGGRHNELMGRAAAACVA